MRVNPAAICDELNALVAERTAQGWDKYWRDCMRFALPQDVSYDALLAGGSISNVTSAITQTSASRNSKNLYDQTSLWAIERLTAGLISLKTPESSRWHKLDVDDPFGHDVEIGEEEWLDRVAAYLFRVRANPQTGFWSTHKAAVRSTCAMGDGFFFIEEQFGSAKTPWTYEFVPLGECYRTVDMMGRSLRFFRLRNLTAEQIARRWPETASEKIKAAANDPKRRTTRYPVVHAVTPREDVGRGQSVGVFSAPFAGSYVEVETKTLLNETGYWEMPYIGHGWNQMSSRSFSEGPMALALGEIKSLNEMAKNELVSSQQAVRPPLARFGNNMTRINLNAGAVNDGLINGDGRMLVQPIMTHTRPDFAQQVLESRRNNVREMLYLNLWQVLIQNPQMTATEAMLRAQEKGDLLGPVGISFNHSLSMMVERELAILGRKGAYENGSPLAAPDTVEDKDITPIFTSPLDRMRNMDEVVGAQRTVAGMMEVAAFDPKIMRRLNVDSYADLLRKGNGAPANLFFDDTEMEEVEGQEEQQNQMAQLAQTLELAKAGGDAAQSIGGGASALQGAAQ